MECPPVMHIKEPDNFSKMKYVPRRSWRSGSDFYAVWQDRTYTYIRRQSDDGMIPPTWWRFSTKKVKWKHVQLAWREWHKI
jgi:hypothetical protein